MLESICIVGGIVISFYITYATRHLEGELAFRLPFGLQMICSTILGIGINFYPFSPRWLALVGRPQDALRSLERLRRLPASDPRVRREHQNIMFETELQQALQAKKHPGVRGLKLEMHAWLDLFRGKPMLRRTAIAVGIAVFQQFAGINAFIYYAPTLFQELGQSPDMALTMAGIFNVLHLVAMMVCFVLIDHVGRRPLAIYGALGAGITWSMMAVLTGVYSHDWTSNPAAGWGAVAMAFLFVIVFGISYSQLAWTLPSEVYTNTTRSRGAALAAATLWLCNFIVGVSTPPMIENLGFGTYVFFGAFCYLSTIWAYLYVPETKGKTLEEMDAVFGDNAAAETSIVTQSELLQRADDGPKFI